MVELKDELLTVAEAAALLKVTPHTVYRWIAAGRLPAVRYSRRVVRVRLSDLAQIKQDSSIDQQASTKGSAQALLRFAGIMTMEEADEVFGAIMADRAASLNDPG